MKNWLKWVFRSLFGLMIVYHVWNFSFYGLDSLRVLKPAISDFPSFASKALVFILYLIGNLLNYIFQIVFPIVFFYFGFIYKGYDSGNYWIKPSFMNWKKSQNQPQIPVMPQSNQREEYGSGINEFKFE